MFVYLKSINDSLIEKTVSFERMIPIEAKWMFATETG
jgi:hypothetical protein